MSLLPALGCSGCLRGTGLPCCTSQAGYQNVAGPALANVPADLPHGQRLLRYVVIITAVLYVVPGPRVSLRGSVQVLHMCRGACMQQFSARALIRFVSRDCGLASFKGRLPGADMPAEHLSACVRQAAVQSWLAAVPGAGPSCCCCCCCCSRKSRKAVTALSSALTCAAFRPTLCRYS